MNLDWVGEFFGALPEVGRALWTFGNGLIGVGVTVGSIALILGCLFLAQRVRGTSSWVAAMLGATAFLVAVWWAFGILPSAWIYFVDSERELLIDTVIPSQIIIGDLEVMSNFYQVFRDSIVMAQQTVALVALIAGALWVQKRYPQGLAEGEERGPTSGGYK